MKKKNKGKGRVWIALALCFSVLLSVAVPVAAVAADGGKELPRPDRAEVDTSYRGWVTVPAVAESGELLLPSTAARMRKMMRMPIMTARILNHSVLTNPFTCIQPFGA